MTNSTKKITAAIVTGYHWYDVINFHRMFRTLPGVDAYIQHLSDFSAAPEMQRDAYDVVVFFMMPGGTPAEQDKSAIERVIETGQGIVIFHHTLFAYSDWQLWDSLVGIPERRPLRRPEAICDVNVRVIPEDVNHPIIKGVSPWEMLDEVYTLGDAGTDNQILLTTDSPESMRTLAWTSQYKKSRVFSYALGHDRTVWENESFRRVLAQGIHWCAEKG